MTILTLIETDSEYKNRYLKHRIENFRREFLKENEVDFEDLDKILMSVEEYLISCDDSVNKEQCIYRIGEARFWLDQYENEDN